MLVRALDVNAEADTCSWPSQEHVLPAAKKQLADWGLEYFDLLLIHFPISLKCTFSPSIHHLQTCDTSPQTSTPLSATLPNGGMALPEERSLFRTTLFTRRGVRLRRFTSLAWPGTLESVTLLEV